MVPLASDDSPDTDALDVSWLGLDTEFVQSALLQENYFPRQRREATELPPVLGSELLSPAVAEELGSVPRRKDPDCGGYAGVELRLTRFDLTLRHAQIPHPYPYASLATTISRGWPTLAPKIASERSGLRPRRHTDGRLFIMSSYDVGDDDAEVLAAEEDFGQEFIVKADIKSFFPSIYTHAIAWAIEGKSAAKRTKHDKRALHNELDFRLRDCRRQETNGVAIGPGTSNVAAELILAEVDRRMAEDGFRSYDRYIDDYTFLAPSYSQAQDFVNRLQMHLHDFELQLNPTKTKIQALPAPEKPNWVSQLILHQPPVGATVAQLNAYMDYAIDLSGRHSNGSVLQYALTLVVGRADLNEILPAVSSRLLNLVFHRPALMPVFVRVLRIVGYDVPQLHDALAKITKAALSGMKSDVASWGIYASWCAGLPVGPEIVDLAIERQEVVPLTLLLTSGAWGGDAVNEYLSAVVDQGDAYDRDAHWLLAYEAYARGLFEEHRDPSFEIMRDNEVRFVLADGWVPSIS